MRLPLHSAQHATARIFGVPHADHSVAERHVVQLGFLRHLLQQAGDPNAMHFKTLALAGGVRLGVDRVIPRIPEVFEEETQKEPRRGVRRPPSREANSKSVEGQGAEVRWPLEAGAVGGWMEELWDVEAKTRFASDLHVASGGQSSFQEDGGSRTVGAGPRRRRGQSPQEDQG